MQNRLCLVCLFSFSLTALMSVRQPNQRSLQFRILILASLVGLHLAPSLSGAQRDTTSISVGGMNGMFDLSARVQVNYHSSYVDSLSTQRGWLQLVILWRGETDWRSRASQDSTPTTGAEREFDRRATNAGTMGGIWSGSQVGTLVYGAIHDRQGKWI